MDLDKLLIEHRKLLERVSALEGRSPDDPAAPVELTKPSPDAFAETKTAFDEFVKRTEADIARLSARLAEIDTQIAAVTQAQSAADEDDAEEEEPAPHRRPRPRR